MLLLTSVTGYQTVTSSYPSPSKSVFDPEHGAPDRDFFIPISMKIQLLTSHTGLRTVTFSYHDLQDKIYPERGRPSLRTHHVCHLNTHRHTCCTCTRTLNKGSVFLLSHLTPVTGWDEHPDLFSKTRILLKRSNTFSLRNPMMIILRNPMTSVRNP